MRILIDIGHPAHVHLYKNLAVSLKEKNYTVFITVKDIPSAIHLLEENKLEYLKLPPKSDTIVGKMFRQIQYNWITWKLVVKQKIAIGLGTSVTLAHVSKLTKMKSIVFDDDEDDVQPLAVKWLHPFATTILSPEALKYKNRLRKAKHTLYYSGFHELAYLHPKHFSPDKEILKEYGIEENDIFFVCRFTAFKAHHDVGEEGLTLKQKLQIIECLKPMGKILITTEREIEPELKQYQIPVSNSNIHHLLYFAKLFVGDSQTMTTEAAVLGTPSIRCNTFVKRIACLDEVEEKYGLTYGFLPADFDLLLTKLQELISIPNLNAEWSKKRKRLLTEKIDVSAFMLWFVENYPSSETIYRTDNNFQQRFR